jgi:hypothetical protein
LVNSAARSSAIHEGSDTNDLSFGDLDLLYLAALASEEIVFPDGCFLYGNDATALAVVCLTAANPVWISVKAREWPLS